MSRKTKRSDAERDDFIDADRAEPSKRRTSTDFDDDAEYAEWVEERRNKGRKKRDEEDRGRRRRREELDDL